MVSLRDSYPLLRLNYPALKTFCFKIVAYEQDYLMAYLAPFAGKAKLLASFSNSRE